MTTAVTVTLRDADDPLVRPGSTARVGPVVPALEDMLIVPRRRLRPRPGRGFTVLEEPVPLFALPDGRTDAVVVWAGIVPRLRRHLAAAGHPVRVVDDRVVPDEFRADRAAPGGFAPVITTGLEKAADALFGRFAVEDAARAWWVGGLAKLFPTAGVVVAAPTKADVGEIADELNGRFGVPARVRNGPGPGSGPARVVVTPHASVAAFAARGAVVLVLVDAHRAVADAHFDGVQRVLPFARRAYGLVPPGRAFDPLTAARLDLVTGDVIGGDAAPIEKPAVTVRFARSGGGRVVKTSDARARTEAAYWANAERNGRVVELARAVAAGDKAALGRLGLGGAPLVTPGCEVAVVAGSVAQAEHLAGRLGWPARTLAPGSTTGDVTGRNVVVTVPYAAEHGLDAGVIVRADGGFGPLAVPGLTGTGCAGKVVVVVDLDDRFDGPARADTARRVDAYRRQGFRVVPADVVG